MLLDFTYNVNFSCSSLRGTTQRYLSDNAMSCWVIFFVENVIRGSGMTCHWIRPVAAPCNVAGGSGMTCHWIRPNVRHIGILHLVLISTISPQSTCHSALVCEILSKSDQPPQKKMTSCRFLRWRISAILDFRNPITGSLKSPCTISYKSSINKIALNCLVFEKIAFFVFWRQTDEQMDSIDALSRSRCRERRLNDGIYKQHSLKYKKLSYRREAAWCLVLLSILVSHWRLL